jgi:hypothetical protein
VSHFRRWLLFYGIRNGVLVLHRVIYGMRDLPSLVA